MAGAVGCVDQTAGDLVVVDTGSIRTAECARARLPRVCASVSAGRVAGLWRRGHVRGRIGGGRPTQRSRADVREPASLNGTGWGAPVWPVV